MIFEILYFLRPLIISCLLWGFEFDYYSSSLSHTAHQRPREFLRLGFYDAPSIANNNGFGQCYLGDGNLIPFLH